MATTNFTLRIPGRLPDAIPMERMGEYIAAFAHLLGKSNDPRFATIKASSIGIVATIASDRRSFVHARLREAQANPDGNPGKSLHRIEVMLGEDNVRGTTILDAEGNVVANLSVVHPVNNESFTLRQVDTIDGVVTGLIGADDTVNLHLRDDYNRDINVVIRDMTLAREILPHFRSGMIRLVADGPWERTDIGWLPKSGKCVVRSFEVLDMTSVRDVLDRIATLPDNGWDEVPDPMAMWQDLRGSARG
ncbi:hypothetical protein [Luteibacter sp.]|uniref:hypothetical protein n=1 Tax=Luteibacter sp. TaxID=1886636 RepID=UPI003F8037BA